MAAPLVLRRTLLALASSVAALAVFEAGFRYKAHRENQETLEAALGSLVEPSVHPNAGMANIIRLSENPRIVYELQPNLVDRTYRLTTVTTNSLGFRSPETPLEARDDTLTIVGLGDSIMFGDGVEEGEPYLRVLESLLNERHGQTRSWRVINTGVPGYNTRMEVETLRTKALGFEPDLVILNIVGNDFAPPKYVRNEVDVLDPTCSFLLDFAREALGPGEYDPVSGRTGGSATVLDPEAAATADDGGAAGIRRGKEWWERDEHGKVSVPDKYKDVFGPKAFRDALDALEELRQEHGFDVLVFSTYELGHVFEMADAARERGFHVVTLMDDVRAWMQANLGTDFTEEAYCDSDLVVGRHNLHPSVLQHRMAGEKLLSVLEGTGWIRDKLAD